MAAQPSYPPVSFQTVSGVSLATGVPEEDVRDALEQVRNAYTPGWAACHGQPSLKDAIGSALDEQARKTEEEKPVNDARSRQAGNRSMKRAEERAARRREFRRRM